ncbi:MAG TPA: TIM barrel protein [Dehalococcoidia bacterium]|nr:TIM barrel protein [Dehalococcoidia bacterium]
MNPNETGELLFGTGGVPVSAKLRSTEAGIERIAELGLGCMEVEFVQGVKMSPKVAVSLGELAARKNVVLTAHGPYFINLNAVEPQKIHMSKERILQTARIAALFGARSITFHAAFYLKSTPAETYAVVKKRLQEVVNTLRSEGNKVTISPEVTGKPSQFGTLEELLQLSSEIEGVLPCIDFSHWHARTGKANSYQEFLGVLDQVEKKLGRRALDNTHIHLSGIAYGNKGEIKHLMLPNSDLQYAELLKALKERKAKGVVISESRPNLEQDALLLQQTYRGLL